MQSATRRSAAAIAVAALSLLAFCFRGPNRALSDSGDFATVYAASRSWTAHLNPYSQADIDDQYALAHGDPLHAPKLEGSLYAPPVFPVVSLVALLDWETAKRVWLALSLIAFAASLACIVARHSVESAIWLIAVFLLFSPVQTGIAKGQPSVICISLLVCAFYLPPSRRGYLLQGLLLGLSCCIKPNIVLPYLLYGAWRRQWRVVGVSLAVTAIFSTVAVCNLMLSAPGWWITWLANLRNSSSPGGSMDPTIGSPASHLLVNFQTVIGFFTVNQPLGDALAFALACILAVSVLLIRKRQTDPATFLSLLTVLVLLTSYHRYYDVQLLMLGAGTAMTAWQRRRELFAWAILLPLIPLWFPLQAIAGTLLSPPGSTSESWSTLALKFLAFRNQPLCLLILAAGLWWMLVNPCLPLAGTSGTTRNPLHKATA